jgi:hypothetical protein
MRIFLCSLIVLTSGLALGALPAATQEPTSGLTVRIVSFANPGHLSIEIDNTSAQPIRIWKDSNSWGAARWRVLFLRNGQMNGFYQNPNQAFSRNGPGFTEIAGGSSVALELDLGDGEWCGFGECSSRDQHKPKGEKISFNRGDVVTVIYDVPRSGEAGEMSVWYGVVAASITVK